MVRRQAGKIGVALLILVAMAVQATPPNNRPPDNRPPSGEINVNSQSEAEAAALAHASASAELQNETTVTATNTATAEGGHGGDGGTGIAEAAGGHATNEGITVEGDEFNSESTNTNVVLVPNNNTSDCNRVYGISFGNGEGAGALGVPFRDKSCDYEQAADDAAAVGNHKIAWWWRCHKPNLYKTFKGKDETKEMAQLKCWNSMVQMLEPQAAVVDESGYMMAQVSEEQLELVENRINQQQNLIQSLEKDHADKDAEIERLKHQAAKLRAEQKQQEDADAARRAAALKALSRKSEAKDDG